MDPINQESSLHNSGTSPLFSDPGYTREAQDGSSDAIRPLQYATFWYDSALGYSDHQTQTPDVPPNQPASPTSYTLDQDADAVLAFLSPYHAPQQEFSLDFEWLQDSGTNDIGYTRNPQAGPSGTAQSPHLQDPAYAILLNPTDDYIEGHSSHQAQIPDVLPNQPVFTTSHPISPSQPQGIFTYQASQQVCVVPPTLTFNVSVVNKGRATDRNPILEDSIIKARTTTKLTLRVNLSSTSHDAIPWDGLLIPRTYPVEQSESRLGARTVKFRLLVHGSSDPATGPWAESCVDCRRHEYRRQYKCQPTPEQFARFHVPLVIFDVPLFVALQGGSADVDFHFQCYPSHLSAGEKAFKVTAQLYEDKDSGSIIIRSHEICSTFELSSRAKWDVIPKRIDDTGTQDGGLAIATAAPVEYSADISSTSPGSHPMPHSATPPTEAQETTRRTNSDQVQTLECVALPTNHVPPRLEQEQEGGRESPTPARTAPIPTATTNTPATATNDTPAEATNDTLVPVLHAVNPENGPTSGGPRINLFVSNLDPRAKVYPRFGCNMGRLAYRRDDIPGALFCDLPHAAQPGKVKVTLFLGDSPDSPQVGISMAEFTYFDDTTQAVGLLLRIVTGQLLPAASTWIQRLLQPTTGTRDAMARCESNDAGVSSSARVLPESAFLKILSAISLVPDFLQRLSTVNEYGQSLLHLAVHLRYRQLVEQLVDWGVGLDVQDMDGFTALHCAHLCEDDLMVKVLQRSGASLSVFDALGRLPTDLLAKPTITNTDVEMAEAADSDMSPPSSEHSSSGNIREHEGAAMERAECSTADEALSPLMSSHSSDQDMETQGDLSATLSTVNNGGPTFPVSVSSDWSLDAQGDSPIGSPPSPFTLQRRRRPKRTTMSSNHQPSFSLLEPSNAQPAWHREDRNQNDPWVKSGPSSFETAANTSRHDPDLSSTSRLCARHQSGSAFTGQCGCDPVTLREASRGHHFTPPAHTNVPSEIWEILAAADVSGTGVPALKFKLRSQAWERLKYDALTIRPGNEEIIDERLSEFIERVGDRFYCRAPNTTGYCDYTLKGKSRILGHLRVHLNFRPFICGDRCGKSGCVAKFSERRYLSQHLNSATGLCPNCDMHTSSRNFKRHVKSCKGNVVSTVA